MRDWFVSVWIASLLACLTLAQQPASKKPAAAGNSADRGSERKGSDTFEAKVRAEWEALKKKDEKAYGELLADDYQGVEADGRGERTRMQAIDEVSQGNIHDYTLWGFRVTPVGPDATFVIYEVTIQFPPKSVLRYSRLYISELWVKRNGEWKELHYQETHVR